MAQWRGQHHLSLCPSGSVVMVEAHQADPKLVLASCSCRQCMGTDRCHRWSIGSHSNLRHNEKHTTKKNNHYMKIAYG